MRMHNWDSFSGNFKKAHLFWDSAFEEIGFEHVFVTGDRGKIMIKLNDKEYLLESLGGGYFTVNDSVALFSGKQLYLYLKQLGEGCVLESIKTQINSIQNRFYFLSKMMRDACTL